jgi:hypothetical protein
MPIPSATERVRDFGLGIAALAVLTPIVYGVCGGGTANEANEPKLYADGETLKDERGEGPAVETACHIIANGGGPVLFIEADPTIAASNGAVQYSGDGPTITISGTSRLDARLRIKIVERGIRGTAKFAYCVDDYDGATDDERTYSETLTVPTGGSFAVPKLGITIAFPAATMGAVTQSGAGPAVTLTGTPAGDYQLVIQIDLGGTRGTATFKWSTDDGATWTAEDVLTAASVVLGSTGLTANFATGTYVLNETYSADTEPYLEDDEYYADVQCAAWNATDLAEGFASLSTNTPWRFFVAVTSKGNGNATAHALLATALQAQLNTLANASKYRRGMISCDQGASAADVISAYSSVEAVRCLLAYGRQRIATTKPFPGYAFPVVHALDSFAARAAGSLPSTDLKRVKSGALPNVVKIFHDEEATPTGLDDVKISTLRTWEGKQGQFYITQGRLKSPSGSDFTLWPRGIVMDMACEIAHQMQIDLIGSGFRYNDDGTLDERDCIRFEEPIGAALVAQLLSPRNAEGFDGHVVDVRYKIKRSHNVFGTGTIIGVVGIRPLGYVDFVEAELGFVVALPEAA